MKRQTKTSKLVITKPTKAEADTLDSRIASFTFKTKSGFSTWFHTPIDMTHSHRSN